MNRIHFHTWPSTPKGEGAFLARFRFFILSILFILSQIFPSVAYNGMIAV